MSSFYNFLLILFIACLAGCSSCATVDYTAYKTIDTLVVENVDRAFIVQTPASYVVNRDYPVVFAIHGTGQLAEKAWDDWGWKEKGNTEKFITVYPQALEYEYYKDPSRTVFETKTKWMDGRNDTLLTAGQVLRDDVLFIREVLAHLRANFGVANDSIYATGFSNGANFTWRLAMEVSDEFKGFAPFAGTSHIANGSPTDLRSVYSGIGNEDAFVQLLNGGVILPMDSTSIVDFMRPLQPHILDALQLTDAPRMVVDSTLVQTLTWATPIDPTHTHEYLFTLRGGTGHVYPSNLNPYLNPNAHHIVDDFWEFFKQL